MPERSSLASTAARAFRYLPVFGLVLAAPAGAQEIAVVSRGVDAIAFVDLTDGTGGQTLPAGSFPHEIAVDTPSGLAYVPSYGGNTIHVFDLRTRSAVTSWILDGHSALHGVRTSRDGSLLWVTAEEERVVVELSTRDGSVQNTWPTHGYRSHMIVSTPDDAKLFVANIDSGTVSSINRISGAVTVISTGAGAEGIDISPDGTEVWVSNRAENTVSIIDAGTDEVLTTFSSRGQFPVKVRFSPDGAQVWVANNRSGSVAVFDSKTRRLRGSVNIGSRPLGLLFSPDAKIGYVSRPGASEIVEIDTGTLAILRRLPVPAGPDGMAWVE